MSKKDEKYSYNYESKTFAFNLDKENQKLVYDFLFNSGLKNQRLDCLCDIIGDFIHQNNLTSPSEFETFYNAYKTNLRNHTFSVASQQTSGSQPITKDFVSMIAKEVAKIMSEGQTTPIVQNKPDVSKKEKTDEVVEKKVSSIPKKPIEEKVDTVNISDLPPLVENVLSDDDEDEEIDENMKAIIKASLMALNK